MAANNATGKKQSSKSPDEVNACTAKSDNPTPPCSQHSVIVEFRPLKTYQGEFGFDWLRVYEGPDTESGYGEELPYVDAQDVTLKHIWAGQDAKFNRSVNLVNRVGWVIDDIRSNDFFKGMEPDHIRAKRNIRNEYSYFNISRGIIDYRLSIYYVPYLNFFPLGTKPAWIKREEDASRIGGYFLNDLGKDFPHPPCEATLQVLIDIKDQKPAQIVLEYDPEYLRIADIPGNLAITPPPSLGVPGKYVLPGSYEITPETYAESVKSFTEISIMCIKAIPADIEIVAWACDAKGNKIISVPVGKMIVRANDEKHQKKMKIALVKVKTDFQSKGVNVNRNGIFSPEEVRCLYKTLHQALIIPDVVDLFIDPHAKRPQPLELDLTQDNEFKYPNGKFVIYSPSSTATDSPLCVDANDGKGYGKYIEEGLEKVFPGILSAFFLVFNFAERGKVGDFLLGGVASAKWKYEGKKTITIVRSTTSVYNSRDDWTLAHELLHTLQLLHSHREGKYLNPTQKYIFPEGETTNVMSYNFNPGAIHATWKWQWEIMQKNANTIIR